MSESASNIDPLHFSLTEFLPFEHLKSVQQYFYEKGNSEHKLNENQVYNL